MFRGFSPNEYPDPDIWLDIILADAAARLNDRGQVQLTQDEVLRLQQAGFTNVIGAGWWEIPRLPLDSLRPHPAMAHLITLWYGEHAVDPAASATPAPDRHVGDVTSSPETRTRWRLQKALDNADQRRLLSSLVRRRDGRDERRRFQRALHRLGAERFNAALNLLITAHLVAVDGSWLVLDPEARRLLLAAQIGVRHRARPRALARARARKSRERARTQQVRDGACKVARRRRPYRPRQVPDYRRRRHDWGVSMRAKKGGYAVQQRYRAEGRHPTEAATRARLCKSAQHQRREAIATTTAPSSSFTASAAQQVPNGPSHSTTAAALSAALQYSEPIGRRERLAAERNRR